METLNTNYQIGAAKRTLKNISKKYHNVSKNCKKELESKGFEFCELGTGKGQYICSKDIKIIENKYGKFLCFGIHNVGVKCRSNGINVSIYRAYVKEIKNA